MPSQALVRRMSTRPRPCVSGGNRGLTASSAQNRPLVEEDTADSLGTTGDRGATQLPWSKGQRGMVCSSHGRESLDVKQALLSGVSREHWHLPVRRGTDGPGGFPAYR